MLAEFKFKSVGIKGTTGDVSGSHSGLGDAGHQAWYWECGWGGVNGLSSSQVRVLAFLTLDQPLGELLFSGFTVTTITIRSSHLQFCIGSLYCLGHAVILLDK